MIRKLLPNRGGGVFSGVAGSKGAGLSTRGQKTGVMVRLSNHVRKGRYANALAQMHIV